MKCEWCSKNTLAQEDFCNRECEKAWKKNELVMEFRLEGEE